MRIRKVNGHLLSSLRQTDAGGAIIEFAIIIPVFVLLAIGVVDFARAFYTGIGVASAARAGAQWGSQSVPASAKSDSIQIAAENDAQDLGSITVNVTRFCLCPDGTTPDCAGTCPTVGYTEPEVFVKVKVTKAVNFIIRYPGLPSTMTFRDSAIYRAQ